MAVLTLHIANGDADVSRLRALGYEHILPWREALADGPVKQRPPNLFETRRAFVTTAYSSSPEEYHVAVEDVFEEIVGGGWQRVVLHFDTDVFCCVNFLFLVAQLGSAPHLIWDLRDHTIELNTMDRVFISSCWRAYASGDPTSLEDLLQQAPSRLQPLKNALYAHLQRFPDAQSGLGRPQELVQEILDRGLVESEDLLQAFIALDDNIYGWGDVQILRERKQLQSIREGSATFILGGVTQTTTGPHWQWDPLKRKLRWSEE